MSDLPQSGNDHLELLSEIYAREFHAFCQRLAMGKPVSEKFISQKLASLNAPTKTQRDTFWERLDGYCRAGSLDPIRLIRVFFASARENQKKLLNFNHEAIFSKSLLANYEKTLPTTESCKELLRNQLSRLNNSVPMISLISGSSDRNEIESNAVSLVNSNYSPLFRCCILAKNGKDYSVWVLDGVREYRNSAEAFDKTWGDFIPLRIRELGSKRRRDENGR